MCPLTPAEKQKRYRQKNRETYLKSERERMQRKRANDPEYVAKERVKALAYYYKNREKQLHNKRTYRANNKEKLLNDHREYMQKKPIMQYAINQANYYTPLMTACEVCESENKLTRHHEEYEQPLAVITVCQKCHSALTVKNYISL